MKRIKFLIILILPVTFLLSACNEKEKSNMKLTDENWLKVSGDQIVNQQRRAQQRTIAADSSGESGKCAR